MSFNHTRVDLARLASQERNEGGAYTRQPSPQFGLVKILYGAAIVHRFDTPILEAQGGQRLLSRFAIGTLPCT
jgi:hypothetical protein